MQFKEIGLMPQIVRALDELGYKEATDIQIGAIPLCLEGKDVIGRSSTGTGKTAAFGIPAVQMVAQSSGEKAQVLVLCPTRELAVQNSDSIRKFAKYVENVSVATVYGGQSMEGQIRELKTAKIVIGTPGRIMDHMRRKTLKLGNLKTVVLDEADEMLNMGFKEDIETILKEAPEVRQTILFSATMPPEIMKITKEFQNDPVIIAVDKGQKTVEQIEQFFYNIPQADKTETLKLLIEYHRPKRALVFCNTKKMVDDLCAALNESGFKSLALHGDHKQSQRDAVMKEFRAGVSAILIATDVAARGLDIDDVEAVFNYDIPLENEYYIHRIGRTGRAGKSGSSHTLVASKLQVSKMKELERFMGTKIEEAPVPSLEGIHDQRKKRLRDEIIGLIEESDGYEWLSFVKELEKEGYDPRDIAAVLCSKLSHKARKLTPVSGYYGMIKDAGVSRSGRVWLTADIGAADKIRPTYIIGAIVEETGLPPNAVGKINVYADRVDFEMKKEDADIVTDLLSTVKIKQKTVHITYAKRKSDNRTPPKRPSHNSYPPKNRRPHR